MTARDLAARIRQWCDADLDADVYPIEFICEEIRPAVEALAQDELAEVAHITAQRDSFRTAWETASRDSAEKGEAARRLADVLSDFIKTGSASADLLRYVRLLDCGPNHCRYCSAKAPEWKHSPTCLFAASAEWTLRAGELRTRFRDLLQDDETAALVERWRTPKE